MCYCRSYCNGLLQCCVKNQFNEKHIVNSINSSYKLQINKGKVKQLVDEAQHVYELK